MFQNSRILDSTLHALPFSIALVTLLTLAGCCAPRQSTLPPITTVPSVDLDRYAGVWYEVARLPMPFQKSGEAALAEYSPTGQNALAVRNTGIAADGTTRSITGRAEPVPESGNAKLRVRFDRFPASLAPVPASGNYWILALDANYQHALVGTPNRKFLWLLSRTPEMPADIETAYVAKARALGYPVDRLVRYR